MTDDRMASFRLGRVLVEPERNRVTTPHGEQALEPKVIAVLCLLAQHSGEVLSRADLIDRVWGVEYGGDESLTRAISLLRKALGDPKAIETISKRGYRLTVAVERAGPTGTRSTPRSTRLVVTYAAVAVIVLLALAGLAAAWRTVWAPPPKIDAITVMVEPFAGEATPARAIGDGLAGEISGQTLYHVRAAPYSTRPNTDLSYVVTGEVETVGANVRVTVGLSDAHDGERLWSHVYERPRSQENDLIAVIASEIQLPLLKAVKTELRSRKIETLEPWQLNLLVTWVPGTEETPGPPGESSFFLQKRALERDPDYAPAHATFAEMLAYHALFDPPSDTPEARRRAQVHADKALQLAPYDPEVLYHVATYYRFTGNRDRAAALLGRVVALQPSYLIAQADLDFVTGYCRDRAAAGAAIARLEALNARLSAANPARWLILSHLADLHLGMGNLERARALAAQSRDIVRTSWSSTTLAAADAALGRSEAGAIAHEHDAQWTRLDYGWFAQNSVPRLCFGGPATSAVQADYAALRKTSE